MNQLVGQRNSRDMVQNIFRLGGWTDLNQVTGPSITALADPSSLASWM